jgi:hypothetical protein
MQPAVDRQTGTCDVSSSLARKERDRVRDLLNRPGSPKRDTFAHL